MIAVRASGAPRLAGVYAFEDGYDTRTVRDSWVANMSRPT